MGLIDKLELQPEPEQTEEVEAGKEHEFRYSNMRMDEVECTKCEIRHGGRINRGREVLRDGRIYAIRPFDKYKAGDLVL